LGRGSTGFSLCEDLRQDHAPAKAGATQCARFPAILLVLTTLAGAAEFRAGVAKAGLEPPIGLPMAGYNLRYAKGTLDPLEARVLALSDGSRTIALVTLDLCFPFEPAIMQEIRAGARGSVDEVVFHASHTHSGPTYSLVPEAAKQAVPRVVAAIQAAVRGMVPARIGSGWGQTYIGFNRRYINVDGSVQMFWRNEPKVSSTFPVDPTVGVIRVDRMDGSPLGILVHYACHPVVLGPDNLDYSADYPGEMRRYVEHEIGGGVMAFFLQGAPGDINPYYDKTPLLEDAIGVMNETGRKLGAEAVHVAGTIQTRAPGKPQIQTKTVTIAVANRWDVPKLRSVLQEQYHLEASRSARLLAENMQLPVTTLLLNQELAFVGMPGEPFVEFQMQLRAKSPLPHSFLLGYTNGYFSYFPTIAAAVRGGYGANSTVVPTEVGTGERMLNTGLISIYELLGKLSERPGKP
jgi:neutral ceramidase